MPVDDEIAVIGNQRSSLCLRLSYNSLASKSALNFELNAAKSCFRNKLSKLYKPVGKGQDFDRYSFLPLLTKIARVLSIIGHYNEFVGGIDHNLFLQETSSPALKNNIKILAPV